MHCVSSLVPSHKLPQLESWLYRPTPHQTSVPNLRVPMHLWKITKLCPALIMLAMFSWLYIFLPFLWLFHIQTFQKLFYLPCLPTNSSTYLDMFFTEVGNLSLDCSASPWAELNKGALFFCKMFRQLQKGGPLLCQLFVVDMNWDENVHSL